MNARPNIEIPDEAIAEFCKRHHIRKMSLFGSVLRGDFTSHSDVDVLVEFEPGTRLGFGFIAVQDELSELLGRKVDLHTPASLHPRIKKRVEQRLEVLYAAN